MRVAVAWARLAGADVLLDLAERCHLSLDVTVGVNNRGTTAEALLRLLSSRSLVVHYRHPRQTFHPKLYWLTDASGSDILVGSSNLTAGGLAGNVEMTLAVQIENPAPDQATRDLATSP